MHSESTETEYLDLYWLPVGAGTRFQRASLVLYEALAAALARRPRTALYHAALKFGADGRAYTLELMPVPARQDVPPLITGPVGIRGADRVRLFRYQLRSSESTTLPDEQWAVDSPVRLASEATAVRGLVAMASALPAYIWGRRAVGTSEMWTSNSAISWLLTRIGVSTAEIALPGGGRAPGWLAGIESARALAQLQVVQQPGRTKPDDR